MIYIKDWFLCIARKWAKGIFNNNHLLVALIEDWTEIKYKVNLETWLLEEVKEN